MTDTHALTGLPSSVTDLALDLTSLAHNTLIALSVLERLDELIAASPNPTTLILSRESVTATVNAWEVLTGLSGDAALDAARQITRHPIPVTAAVVPF